MIITDTQKRLGLLKTAFQDLKNVITYCEDLNKEKDYLTL